MKGNLEELEGLTRLKWDGKTLSIVPTPEIAELLDKGYENGPVVEFYMKIMWPGPVMLQLSGQTE